jgi:hypothetical protein
VAPLGTATICFQTTSGELLAYDTDVIQLNVSALFGHLLMHISNADVLVSLMQQRSPIWSADLREHEGHLFMNEKRDIVTSNYLEAGVPDAVNLSDKPVVNDDGTTGSAQNRSQKVANVINNTNSCSRFRSWHCTSCFFCQSSQGQRCHGSRGDINAINKEVRGLFNRGEFSLVHVEAVLSLASNIGTRIITRLKHLGTIDEEAKARLIIQRRQDAE